MKNMFSICLVLLVMTFAMHVNAEESLITKVVFEHIQKDIQTDVRHRSQINQLLQCSADGYANMLEEVVRTRLLEYGVAKDTASTFSLLVVRNVLDNCAMSTDDPRRYNKGKALEVALHSVNHHMASQNALWNGQGFTQKPSSRIDYDIGYAFNTIDGLFKSGSPKVSLSLYRQFCDNFHLATSFGLVSAAEETAVSQDRYSASNLGSNKVLEVSITPFFMRSTGEVIIFDHLFASKLGVVGKISASMKDTNAVSRVQSKYYLGFRTALGPRFYTDILFGKTDGLQSTRMELKGECLFTKKMMGTLFIWAIA